MKYAKNGYICNHKLQKIMRIYYTFLLSSICLASQAQTTYKGIKQITVYTKEKTDKSPQLEYDLYFDKQGNQTKYHHPTYYCTQEYTYNAQNKVTKRDIMCGESMGNGITTYKYTPKINTSEEVTGSYKRVITDSLDAQNLLISSNEVFTPEENPQEGYTTRTTFTYNARKQLLSSATQGKAGKQTKQYVYNKIDSLQFIIRTIDTKKDTLLVQDFDRTTKKIASKKYPVSDRDAQEGYYSEIYRYDEKGRFYTITKNIKNATSCPNPKVPCAIELKEYVYKNDQLFQTTETFYTKGAMTSYTITLYGGGIEREKKIYNDKNEFTAHTTYKIQKW